jgi:hypothetical protein
MAAMHASQNNIRLELSYTQKGNTSKVSAQPCCKTHMLPPYEDNKRHVSGLAAGVGAQGLLRGVRAQDAAQLHQGRLPAAARRQAARRDECDGRRQRQPRSVQAEVPGQLFLPRVFCFDHQGKREQLQLISSIVMLLLVSFQMIRSINHPELGL